jgi:hypothetical protein
VSAVAIRETTMNRPLPAPTTREDLIAELAEICHATWMRQKNRDHHVPWSELEPKITDHDLERAEDIVRALEQWGLWPRGE